tara:strand:- start:202 stop:1233 length:1032 start_codon:yes stop_codon:yes gene_type:complete
MDKTKISVITSCLNSGKYLKDTILSILNQSYNNYELIIIDAGSSDSTNIIMKEFVNESKIKFHIEENIGLYDGLKLGVEKSKGEYIMFMPVSDSYCSMDWLKVCNDALDKNNKFSLIHGISIHNNEQGSKYFGTATRENCPSGKNFFSFWLATFYAFSEHSLCIRKNVYLECMSEDVKEIESFNDNIIKYGTDNNKIMFNDFLKLTYNFNRLGYLSKYIPKIAAEVKIHPNSNSINDLENNYDISALYTEMIKNYGTRLFTGEIKHKFKNGNGIVIDTLEGYELSRCIRSTITFRLYEKKYFTNKDKLNWAGSKLTFKAKYLFAFTIRIIIDLYYKIYRLFSK